MIFLFNPSDEQHDILLFACNLYSFLNETIFILFFFVCVSNCYFALYVFLW